MIPLSSLFAGDRDSLGRYIRTHLAGSNAGIRLFGRSGRNQFDPDIGAVVLEIAEQLVEERDYLQVLADLVGPGENLILSTGAAVGEKVGRLKPNGSLLRRTAMTDLVELETMRVAVSGKLAGWESLLAIVDDQAVLEREDVERFRDQAIVQLNRLGDVHAIAARRALAA